MRVRILLQTRMKPKLSKRELALLMQILNPIRQSDYWDSIKDDKTSSKLLKQNGIRNAETANKTADKAYDKLRTEYLKRNKK